MASNWGGRNGASVAVVALILGMFAVVAVPETVAASDLCGATITTSMVLTHNLACTGLGIRVGADGVTIWLNGRTISGPSDTMVPAVSGILLEGRTGVSIRGPGTVKGFFAGVRIVSSSDITVKGITVMESHEAGIRLESSTRVRIVENTAFGGGHDAIQLRLSHGNTIKENVATATDPTGCAINLVSSNNNVVNENALSDSGTSGVQLGRLSTNPPSSDNLIVENEIRDNTHGIRAWAGANANVFKENEVVGNVNGVGFIGGADALGNTFIENEIRRNVCGVKGSATELSGNTFLDNEFKGNVDDMCLE